MEIVGTIWKSINLWGIRVFKHYTPLRKLIVNSKLNFLTDELYFSTFKLEFFSFFNKISNILNHLKHRGKIIFVSILGKQ